MNLELTLAGVKMKNPVIAASGTFGFGREYARYIDVGALGGVCTKGLTLRPKAGNEGERLFETPAGLLNSIGLQNPGVEAFISGELPAMRAFGTAIFANLGGESVDDYTEGARLLSRSSVDAIELNISCPNVRSGGMAFGLEADCAGPLVRAVRAVSEKPLIVKLSPNAGDLIGVARACVRAGADALSLVNTFKAMAIDTEKRVPVFRNVTAGLSGPAIRPVALRMVWELCADTEVPVIGIGGIDGAVPALEFLLAGARAVQVGSATFARPETMSDVISGIESYMTRHGISSLDGLKIQR